jgi:pSer/pThr/pTyr-binding forkhead associated (FHA) protein
LDIGQYNSLTVNHRAVRFLKYLLTSGGFRKVANEVYQLVVRKGPRPGQVFPLELDVLTIGRDPISDIVIEDPEISRQHAKVMRGDSGNALQDMGSTNGTFVDGKRLSGEPTQLKPGQVIMLGSNVTLVYQAAPELDPLATVVGTAAVAEADYFEPEPAPEEPVEALVVEQAADEPLDEPVIVPAAADPISVEPAEPSQEPEPLEDEDDALATMLEDRPAALEQPPVEIEPLPAFDEPGSEPDPDQLPDFEAPTPLPSFEEPEPALGPPPTIDEGTPPVEKPFDQTVFDSGEPLPDFDAQPVGSPPPQDPADIVEGKKGSDRNRNIIIAIVVVVLLCCCCLLILGALFYSSDSFQDFAALDLGQEIAENAATELLF